ncbi:CLUMA_CG010506, isoform A [Clunio marinus]|uniref:CLUMA_CG010506, isoform A n=1 Tax=Clunio marinus TaxID=568069 RepID=A0A1J1IF67_9DIPT|nr:CLUMA_CG010506, isoform A [Clunio marinus]
MNGEIFHSFIENFNQNRKFDTDEKRERLQVYDELIHDGNKYKKGLKSLNDGKINLCESLMNEFPSYLL